jgi:hypothetical protein
MGNQFPVNPDVSRRNVSHDPVKQNFVRAQSIERLACRLLCLMPRVRAVEAIEGTGICACWELGSSLPRL